MILLLGFFTSTSMQRWFTLVNTLPGTIKVTSTFVHALKQNHPEGAQVAQQFARWILLSWTLVFRLVCPTMKEAYPDLMSLQNEGLLLEHERLQLETEPARIQPLAVITWASALVRVCARREMFGILIDYPRNVDNLNVFKKSCNNTIKFADKNIPSALIQVVSIAVYAYGLATLFARPPALKSDDEDWYPSPMYVISGYVPIINVVQFFLFYSWLKFGRLASNPFGNDEDDINVRQLFYCHIKDAFQIAALYSNSGPVEEVVMASLHRQSPLWAESYSEEKLETLHQLLTQKNEG